MADKIFIGKVCEDKFAIASLELNGEDMDKLQQYFRASPNAKVKIKIKESLKGKKYAEIDTWAPNQNNAPQQTPQQASNNFYKPVDDDQSLPF